MAAASIDIRRTDDRRAAVALGIAGGLDERGPGDVDVAAMWGAYDGDSLVGAVALGTLHGLTVGAAGTRPVRRATSATRSSWTVSTAAASAAPAVRRSSSSAGRDGL